LPPLARAAAATPAEPFSIRRQRRHYWLTAAAISITPLFSLIVFAID
jgi:hypothetical protein